MAEQHRSNAEEAVALSYGMIAGTIRREFRVLGPNSRAVLAKLVIEECRELANKPLLTQQAVKGGTDQ